MRSYRVCCIFIVIPALFFSFFNDSQVYSQDLGSVDLNRVSKSFEALSEKAGPSIVQVFASGYVVPQGYGQSGSWITRQSQGGSGVILGEDGYIVTNAHVVNGAQRVQVLLARKHSGSPGRSILKPRGETIDAEVLAIDSETDLAVLKIPVTGLPVLELGDSDELRPGQLVFAFGSPLGLDNFVSMGVISSAARPLRPDDPMIYIQTDASINPGNSGGPLIDSSGRVVGINTFILSQSGGNEGIGFAAPSNIVRNVYFQIRVSGRVRRGEIGVNAQTITPELAQGIGLSRDWGVVLGDVYPFGPADRAGLESGDVVVSLDGKIMENGRQFDVNLYSRSIGDIVTLEVQRGLEVMVFQVPVIERKNDPERFYKLVDPKNNQIKKLGIMGLNIDDTVRSLLPQIRYSQGVVVAAQSSPGSGSYSRLQTGDIIYVLNDNRMQSIADIKIFLEEFNSGETIIAHIERNGQLLYIPIEIP